MTPIGHGATGYLLYRLLKMRWPRVMMGSILLGSLLPDIDFLFVILFGSVKFHRTFTHSLFFVIFIAFIIFLTLKKNSKRRLISLGLLLGGLLHILIDACEDTSPATGMGIPLLWPFSQRRFLFFNYLFWFQKDTWGSFTSFLQTQLASLLTEVPFVILALFLFFRERGLLKE